MKKFLLLFIVVLSFNAFAQSKTVGIKAGYYFPADLKSGMILGFDYGYRIDESVSIMFGTDFYYKSINEDVNYGEAQQLGVKIEQYQHLSQWIGWHLPFTLKARVEIPIQDEAIKPFATAGLGYGFTHISYENLEQKQSASFTYNGFVWQLGGGIMFGLGSKSQLVVEALYNGASFDKDVSETRFTTLNSSGFALRAGINFYLSKY
jgi:hypothetical protein